MVTCIAIQCTVGLTCHIGKASRPPSIDSVHIKQKIALPTCKKISHHDTKRQQKFFTGHQSLIRHKTTPSAVKSEWCRGNWIVWGTLDQDSKGSVDLICNHLAFADILQVELVPTPTLGSEEEIYPVKWSPLLRPTEAQDLLYEIAATSDSGLSCKEERESRQFHKSTLPCDSTKNALRNAVMATERVIFVIGVGICLGKEWAPEKFSWLEEVARFCPFS